MKYQRFSIKERSVDWLIALLTLVRFRWKSFLKSQNSDTSWCKYLYLVFVSEANECQVCSTFPKYVRWPWSNYTRPLLLQAVVGRRSVCVCTWLGLDRYSCPCLVRYMPPVPAFIFVLQLTSRFVPSSRKVLSLLFTTYSEANIPTCGFVRLHWSIKRRARTWPNKDYLCYICRYLCVHRVDNDNHFASFFAKK